MEKECLYCGKVFYKTKTQSVKTWNEIAKYCSRECVGHATGKERFIALNKSRTGLRLKEETKEKMKKARVGRKPMLGKKHSDEAKLRIKKAIIKAQTPEVRLKKSLAHRGAKSYNWKGGRTGLKHSIRTGYKYREWRLSIFERDNFACTECEDSKGGNLQAHHIETLMNILDKYKIKTLEEADKCGRLWDINNGITFCKKCHIEIHK